MGGGERRNSNIKAREILSSADRGRPWHPGNVFCSAGPRAAFCTGMNLEREGRKEESRRSRRSGKPHRPDKVNEVSKYDTVLYCTVAIKL